MMIMRRQVYQHLTAALGDAEREAIQLMLDSFKRPDFRKGVVSFLEKRPPLAPLSQPRDEAGTDRASGGDVRYSGVRHISGSWRVRVGGIQVVTAKTLFRSINLPPPRIRRRGAAGSSLVNLGGRVKASHADLLLPLTGAGDVV